MKIFSLVFFGLLAVSAQAAPAHSNLPAAGEGIFECGRYYYSATLTARPTKVTVFSNESLAGVHFKNSSAEAVCGGEVVDSRKVTEQRGRLMNLPPRFIQEKTASSARVGLLDSRTLRLGKSYEIACAGRLVQAQVADLRVSSTSFVRFQFKDTAAEKNCGEGRFHAMGPVLDRTQKLQDQKLGFR